ncbi:MAG: hypothetical protein KDD52_06770 [Bdellovibrionales bacterium]|nr:hypothetical protein [Bdellovibrionales bacterium]
MDKIKFDEDVILGIEETLAEISKFHFILEEGQKGLHILFSPEMIRETFSSQSQDLSDMFHDHLEEINKVINESFQFETIEEKRNYFASLSKDLQKALVYGYFQLIDGQSIPEERTFH